MQPSQSKTKTPKDTRGQFAFALALALMLNWALPEFADFVVLIAGLNPYVGSEWWRGWVVYGMAGIVFPLSAFLAGLRLLPGTVWTTLREPEASVLNETVAITLGASLALVIAANTL